MHVGIICPCLPSFRLLLRKLMPRIVGTNTGNYELDGRQTTGTGTKEMVGGRDSVPVKGIKRQQTIVAHESNSTLRSEKVSQDYQPTPCDAWSFTELVGTKTEIKAGSRA